MTELLSLVVCENVNVNQMGLVSLNNMYTNLQVPKVPMKINFLIPWTVPVKSIFNIFFLLRRENRDKVKFRFHVKYEGIGNDQILKEIDMEFKEDITLGAVSISELNVLNFGVAKFYCSELVDGEWKEFDTVFKIKVRRIHQRKIINPQEAMT